MRIKVPFTNREYEVIFNMEVVSKIIPIILTLIGVGLLSSWMIKTETRVSNLEECVIQLQEIELERMLQDFTTPRDTIDYLDHGLLIDQDTVINGVLYRGRWNFIPADECYWRPCVSYDRTIE